MEADNRHYQNNVISKEGRMKRSPLKWILIMGVIVMAAGLIQVLVELWKFFTLP